MAKGLLDAGNYDWRAEIDQTILCLPIFVVVQILGVYQHDLVMSSSLRHPVAVSFMDRQMDRASRAISSKPFTALTENTFQAFSIYSLTR